MMQSFKYYRICIFTFLLSALLVSCRGRSEAEKVVPGSGRSDMTELNRFFVQKDREIIENYIERKGLDMQETPTGLWYFIKKEGRGNLISDNNKVMIAYDCSLMDGTKCYSSDDSGPKEIVLGKTGVEQGLYEGLKLLRPGAEAVFIIPPFLAHGLIGDRQKIPPRAIIVYEIRILSVE